MTFQLGIEFDRREEELTREEELILSLLEPGKDNARSVRWLADMAGLEERELRKMVRHLVDEHCACIGSSTGNPPGYYMIDCPEEIEQVYARLRHRGISILQRAARLKKTSVVEVFGQGEL